MKKKLRTIFYSIVLSLTLVLSYSCGPSERNVKKQVAEMLQKRYHEEFEIKSVHEQYIVHPSYHLYVYPKKHPNWVFEATLSKERENDLVDNYPRKKLIFQATEDFENHFKNFGVNFRACVEPRIAISDSIAIDYANLLRYKNEGDIINLYVYEFGNLEDTSSSVMYDRIRKYAHFFLDKGVANIEFEFKIFDKKVLPKKDLNTFNFCFYSKLVEANDCFDTNHIDDILFSVMLHLTKNTTLPSDEELKEKINVRQRK